MEFQYEVKIPKERIAVLIGKKGEIKRRLQKKLNVKIEIDSQEGDVIITGEDSLNCVLTQNIIKAIARGFTPQESLELLKEDTAFELLDTTDFVGKEKNRQKRIKARVIGTDGKARKAIEEMTETKIVIFGKTVGIIGEYQNVHLARRALESLLGGSQHKGVYLWLEKQKKKMMER